MADGHSAKWKLWSEAEGDLYIFEKSGSLKKSVCGELILVQ